MKKLPNSAVDFSEYYFLPLKMKLKLGKKAVFYFDVDNIITNMLEGAGISLRIIDAYESNQTEYRAFIMEIKSSQKDKFAKAMKCAAVEMTMHGHKDYASFFQEYYQKLSNPEN